MSEEILKLKKEIERLKKAVKKQRYGLVWMDVPEAFEDDVENKLPILKEMPKLAIKNNDGKPTHILIEGDNYHALTCLNYTHKGKIDVVYIDPPYNTGSDGFRYKDKRILDKYPDGTEVPKDHPFRHSYWLSFMAKRLELAKDILKESGVIFISIDDNEFAQLKILCDEIFGEKNFINQIIWKKTNSPKFQSFGLGNQHESVFVYAKDKNKLNLNRVYKPFDVKSLKPYAYKDERGKFRLIELEAKGLQNNEGRRKSVFKGREAAWLYSLNTLNEWDEKGLIYKTKNGRYAKKQYLDDMDGVLIADIWIDEEIAPLQGSSEEYISFETQKPLSLIKRILKLSSDKNSIILDFFAGSGTTGEAVIGLNEDDKGLRQFILVTNNDEVVNGTRHKIMSDVCYPRIKKISKASKNGVKFYKTAFIGKNNILNATDQDKIELAHNAGELLAIAENTLDLTKQNKFYQLFENGNKEKYTAVYFREELDKFDEFIEIVKKLKKQTAVYIFSWGNEEDIEEFDDIEQIKIKTIPLPILEIYKQIYNLSC